MAYVRVVTHTKDRLHLARQPGFMSWAIVVGLASLGLGASYFSTHNNIYEALFVLGAIIVGVQLMDDWEECILDKSTGKVSVSKLTASEKMLSLVSSSLSSRRSCVDEISEVVDVSVDEEDLKFAGRGHCVLIKFAAGYELGVTESFTLDELKEHERIAQLIRDFLGIKNEDVVTSSSDEEETKTK